MRIRFAVPDSAETSAVRELAARADAFFAAALARFSWASLPADHAELERDLTRELSFVSPGLLLEVSKSEGEHYRIALFPAEDSGLEPLVGQVLRQAPVASHVEFVRHRAETDAASVLAEVRGRYGLDLSEARLRIGFSRGHLLDVVVHSSVFSSTTDETGLDAANLLVMRLIGDELFDDWVGAVDIAPAPRGGPLKLLTANSSPENTLSLDEALPSVEAAIRGVYAELPDKPYRFISDDAKWTLLESEPGAEIDYPAQDDVALKSTVLPEALKCFLEHGRFSSKRFSRHGETLVYVKVDALDDDPDARHELRVGLEDCLGKALAGASIGCVVGAGLGVRYVYIDVVLENVDRGISVLREALRGLDINRRSWILFCDGSLSHEWIGVWDDTPPPP